MPPPTYQNSDNSHNQHGRIGVRHGRIGSTNPYTPARVDRIQTLVDEILIDYFSLYYRGSEPLFRRTCTCLHSSIHTEILYCFSEISGNRWKVITIEGPLTEHIQVDLAPPDVDPVYHLIDYIDDTHIIYSPKKAELHYNLVIATLEENDFVFPHTTIEGYIIPRDCYFSNIHFLPEFTAPSST